MVSGSLNLHERYRIHALSDAGHSLRIKSMTPTNHPFPDVPQDISHSLSASCRPSWQHDHG